MSVYSVSQITAYLREILNQDTVLNDVWIRGEISNLAQPGSGHSYFSLRESSATLRCAMFRQSSGNHLLTEGGEIIAHGRVSVYEARGDVQLIVDIIQPEGVGDLQLQLQELKVKLENEGLFDTLRKREIPDFPKRIGVVTSPAGAVWHDIQTVISRRYPLAELVLSPTPVQGSSAVRGIVQALTMLNKTPNIDSIILARGGGSIEDLWPFNDESVARAVFGSCAPIITGIGHETDLTISDLVADKQAPTPSAAAELIVPDRIELASFLFLSQQTQTTSINNLVRSHRDTIDYLTPRLGSTSPDLDQLRVRTDDLLSDMTKIVRQGINSSTSGVDSLISRLGTLGPLQTLRRGYAIVEASESVVTDASLLHSDDQIEVTLTKGRFHARVTSVHPSERSSV